MIFNAPRLTEEEGRKLPPKTVLFFENGDRTMLGTISRHSKGRYFNYITNEDKHKWVIHKWVIQNWNLYRVVSVEEEMLWKLEN